MNAAWDHLLAELKAAYETHPDLRAFAEFPDDLSPTEVIRHPIPAAALLAAQTGLSTDRYAELRDAIIAVGPDARWRETYKDTDIGQDFLDRFGCFSIIGAGGAYGSEQLWSWVVYMPPRLHYPWHHHPGEEIYFVLAGSAEFHREGKKSETLVPGGTSLHQSNQPHAMTTQETPVLALVFWRNGFSTAPVLTE